MRTIEIHRAVGLVSALAAIAAFAGCSSDSDDGGNAGAGGSSGVEAGNPLCKDDAVTVARPDWWTRASHCSGEAANYDEVFDTKALHRIDIVVLQTDYQAMLEDLDENYSGGGFSGDLDALPNPIYVPATVSYGGHKWTQVGLRWKGHASLKGAWQRGVRKLSFTLDFDQYEAAHPELADQKFHGFGKLSFSNAYNDPSLIRDKTAAELFRAAGVPAARSAFAPVYFDTGSGPKYIGLYTVIEDPADRMLEAQIGDDSGNLYKPWGEAARWLSLTDVPQTDVETYFEKESVGSKDWADVLAAIHALHGDRTAAATWRSGLEAVFDVPAFLKALAVNQVMANWDSYGCMHHNYFVYANPKNEGRLLWFPWDLNESMKNTEQEKCPPPGSVMFDEIVKKDPAYDYNWPLIQFLLADTQYAATYKTALQQVLDGAFAQDALIAQMQADHDLIAPYVIGPTETESFPYTNTTADDFNASLTGGTDALADHVKARCAAVEAGLKAE